ncbi:MAG: hypothetical protein LBT55_04075 [Clostridiaceae bacterium]|jgi:hypothetical protein|nr:hypothetical protein [Clostridiaceae bacterium]
MANSSERTNIHPKIIAFVKANAAFFDSIGGRKLEVVSNYLYICDESESVVEKNIIDAIVGEKNGEALFSFLRVACPTKEALRVSHRDMSLGEKIQTHIKLVKVPLGIACHSDTDWFAILKKAIPNFDPVILDAHSITFEELCGQDYQNRTYFKPSWFSALESKKIVVIDNLDQIHPQDVELDDDNIDFSEYGDKHPGQVSFLFLCRGQDEGASYRSLIFGSPYSIPNDTTVIVIMKEKHKYPIIQPILSRIGIIEM